MKIDKIRALKALGIGVLITLPILYVYLAGEGSEDTVLNALASGLMTPAMILAAPLLFLAPFFEDSDRYMLGAYFYVIPFLSVLFYAIIGYGGLTILLHKK